MSSNWFADLEDTNPSFLRMTRNILVFTIIANLAILLLVVGLFFRESQNAASSVALSVTLVLEIASLIFVLRGNPIPAKIVVPVSLFVAVTYTAINANGLHDLSMLGFPTVIVVSALLLRKRALIISTPIAVLCVEIVAFADMTGITNSEMALKTDVSDALIAGILMIAISFLLQLLITRLNESAEEARNNAALQVEANKELLSLQANLENRIESRTRELNEVNAFNERRAANFEAAAQLARTVASIRDINKLLPAIAEVISARFDYYHVGIFLNDDTQEYTSLVAANSEIGKQLMAGGLQYKIGQAGFVPSVAQTGYSRVSQDHNQIKSVSDSQEFQKTQSELVLPMKIENKVLGVLDMHSDKTYAFDEVAIEILSILADQTAIAIQNARAYEETQAALAESQILYGTVIKQAWQTNVRVENKLGYRFSGTIPMLLEKPVDSQELQAAFESGKTVILASEDQNRADGSVLAVPLILRGETVGVIHVKTPADIDMGEDEADIVRATAERVVLALENSTLLEESQRRALREQTIGQISSKISAGTEIEMILKTAVRELGSQISGAQISVEIGSDNDE
ncbi:MAG TPA: GAF domain-containing protein [Anaerolineales bacterium]|nr:GAF domain-containing protein [Anaerolineales bacterium]HMV96185.1 GAF domain-containing protein [Anaerolineales bacterium]HMX19374.1 GAF domain-containing protein [Anaerolineales bacterium]HMX73585.1 GAF domain-containing protein [Anaerolineales bacterium]HMZ43158.1 GAF domain-containing protein [Anaerolineales bacterium]